MPLTITDAGVDVTITRATRAPTQQDFGVLLFISENTAAPLVTSITKFTSMNGVAAVYNASSEVYKAAQAYYSQSPRPIDFWVGLVSDALWTADVGADIMDALYAVDPAFFAFALDKSTRDTTVVAEYADWAQANDRVLFYTSNDAQCKNSLDTTNVLYEVKQGGISNAYGHYSSHGNEYPEVAAFAILATTSYRGKNTVKTLKFKDLVGITPESIDVNDLSAIKGFQGNVFYEVAGIRMCDEGRTGVLNTFIDTVINTYALADEIRTRVFGHLARVPTKVALTEPGVAEIKANAEGGLIQFRENGFLAEQIDPVTGDIIPAYEITSLPVALLSEADKAARISPDIQFVAREAGAWHSGKISGTLVL